MSTFLYERGNICLFPQKILFFAAEDGPKKNSPLDPPLKTQFFLPPEGPKIIPPKGIFFVIPLPARDPSPTYGRGHARGYNIFLLLFSLYVQQSFFFLPNLLILGWKRGCP